MRQKRKHITLVMAAALCVALSGCAQVEALLGKGEESAQSSSALAEGEREVYGKVVQANGNEITLALGTPDSGGLTESARPEEEPDAAAAERAEGSGRKAADRSGQDAERSGGERERGETAPEDGGEAVLGTAAPPGDFPGGGGDLPFDLPDGGAAPSAEGQGGRESRRQGVSLTLTGEQETFLIPVGTPVLLGTGNSALTSNFMQIMVDNTVRLVLIDREDGTPVVLSATILG